jgi:hypothetical protein
LPDSLNDANSFFVRCLVFGYPPDYSDFCKLKIIDMTPFKRSFLLIGLMIIALLSSAQETITRSLPAFHRLSAMGKMRVELYKSDSSRIEVSVSNAPATNLITEVKDSILNMRLKIGTNKSAIIKVLVFYTRLTDITVAANTLLLSPETIIAESMKFTARTGSKMELELDIKNIKADVKQGSILVFTGKTNRQDIRVNTGATYSAYKLKAEDTYVTAIAGSKAKVCAARIINASSNMKSYVGYIGVPVNVYIKTNLGGVVASFANEDAVFED